MEEGASEDTGAADSAPQNFDQNAASSTQLGSASVTTGTGSSPISAAPAASPSVSSSASIEPQAPQKEAPKVAASSQMTATRPAHQRPPVAINDEYLEELEEKLIRADLGVATAEALVQDLRKDAKAKNWNSHDVEAFLKKEFASMLATDSASKLKFVPGKLNIYLVVGVNGTGKTTSIGKLSLAF